MKRRGTSKLIVLSIGIFLTYSYSASAKLLVIDNPSVLDSSDPVIDYPNNVETLDVIWLFDHSIRLHLREFHLNGHAGDFVLISELPLLNPEYFRQINDTSDEPYEEELSRSIVTDQGILLSWKVTKTFEAINNQGTFVLFHSEAKDQTPTEFFKGFDIEVVDYDKTITTTTSTTPDPYVPPKEEEHYITKFLNCKEPLLFIQQLDDFKQKIAHIATEYCNESSVSECLDRGNIAENEVNIPGANEGTYAGLHYCDKTWETYYTCVEVTFAIMRTNSEGSFVLPTSQLERMWSKKSDKLREHGYCPYEPPEVKLDLNTIVWIAFFLGIILSLTCLLGIAWLNNTRRTLLSSRKSIAEDSVKPEEKLMGASDERHQQKHYDERNNPIYNIIPKSFPRDDHLYPSSDYLQVEDGEEGTSAGLIKKRSTDNPTFQHVDADVYAYDNTGFEEEENQPPFTTSNTDDHNKIVMRSRNSRTTLSDSEI